MLGDDFDVDLWRRRHDDNVVALAKVPIEAFDHARSSVLFEVRERKDPRRRTHVVEGAAREEAKKESFLGLVGPGTTAQCAHEDWAGESKCGEVRGASAAELAQPLEDTAAVAERTVEVERRHDGRGKCGHYLILTGRTSSLLE